VLVRPKIHEQLIDVVEHSGERASERSILLMATTTGRWCDIAFCRT